MAVYVESLQPFQPWELEAGVKLALESHKYAKWPKPAEMREFCLEAQREARQHSGATGPDKRLPKYLLDKPARLPISEAERELVNMKIQVRQEWEANGKYMAKNPDGTWIYSAADCKAEALRRLERERAA